MCVEVGERVGEQEKGECYIIWTSAVPLTPTHPPPPTLPPKKNIYNPFQARKHSMVIRLPNCPFLGRPLDAAAECVCVYDDKEGGMLGRRS